MTPRCSSEFFQVLASAGSETDTSALSVTNNQFLLAGTGIAVIEHKARGDLYIFNHFEYEADTLRLEYERDIVAEDSIGVPANYFPGDDPAAEPVNTWRPYGYLIFSNWIGGLYHDTPFDLDEIGKGC